MLTTNYNVVQVSSMEKDKYSVGQIFTVPDQHRNNWRFMKFDGLVIESIAFGFGIFLHFNREKWFANQPKIKSGKIKPSGHKILFS